MRVVILGPPAVGKSTVAEQLCDYFKLHHVHVKQVIDDSVDRMVRLLLTGHAVLASFNQ